MLWGELTYFGQNKNGIRQEHTVNRSKAIETEIVTTVSRAIRRGYSQIERKVLWEVYKFRSD